MNRETEKYRYMINASLTYKFADWIDITGRVKVDNSHYRLTQERYASTLGNFSHSNGFYSDQTRTDRNVYADVMLNINKRIADFSINANIGASIKDLQYEQAGGEEIWRVFPTSLPSTIWTILPIISPNNLAITTSRKVSLATWK